MNQLEKIRNAEARSHMAAYASNALYEPGSWLARPVKTVMELVPQFADCEDFRALDLGCGVGRNAIALAKALPGRIDCVDILPLAVDKLRENARQFGVEQTVCGMVSSIDDFVIQPDAYDLILAVSALEHVACEDLFARKLEEIRRGLRQGGAVCLIVNTGVRERDRATGEMRTPQFEVNMPTEEMRMLVEQVFAGWEVLKDTTVHQAYDIPRDGGIHHLQTEVVTWVARRRDSPVG